MEAKELIALFMIFGVVFLGVFAPLYKYARYAVFYGVCLAFVVGYAFLASKALYIGSDLPSSYVMLYKSANLQNHVMAAFTAVIYLCLAVVCSYVYGGVYKEKNRKSLRWVGVFFWVILVALFYDTISDVDKSVFYFNTCVCMFLPVAAITMLVVPVFMMLISYKKIANS